jgi:antitoxin component of MazEF toxin-antitoxin module
MAGTKLFKNGNSQAVRIPSELAYSSWDIELVIERQACLRTSRLHPSKLAQQVPTGHCERPTVNATKMRWTS